MNFGIIIPAHNEADSIELTLNSLFNQTFKASQIIVVDDGSTDNTLQILQRIQEENPILQIIRKTSNKKHLPGSKIVQAFNEGLSLLKENTDIICKFDADLIFPKNYLEVLNGHFEQNPKVGMCGGFCYIEKKGKWVIENLTNKDHLRGTIKTYRNTCFSDIGGLKIAMGWDTADELLARFYGWEVKTDNSLKVKHLRPTGAGYNSQARYLQGSVFYRLRYGLVLSFIASVKLALKKKSYSLFKDYLVGYFKARKQKQPFLVTPKQGKWIRKYRWKNIFKKFFKVPNDN